MSDYKRRANKKIQIIITNEDWQLLKQFSEELGSSQGFTLHVLLEAVQLLVGSAVESGIVDDKTKIPNVELFVALVMWRMNLLTNDQFERELLLADAMLGENANMRLQGLAAFANEQLDVLKPTWESARVEAKALRAAAWQEQVTGLKQSIAAVTGAQMVAAEKAAIDEAKYQEAAAWDGKEALRRHKLAAAQPVTDE